MQPNPKTPTLENRPDRPHPASQLHQPNFSPCVLAVRAQDGLCRHQAVDCKPGSKPKPRGERRRTAAGRPPRPQLASFAGFAREVAFCTPGARRVLAALGLFDVGPCPTLPGVCATRVACRGMAREAAQSGHKTSGFRPPRPNGRGEPRKRETHFHCSTMAVLAPPAPHMTSLGSWSPGQDVSIT